MNRVVFLYMSKQVGVPGLEYGWQYKRDTPPASPFHNLGNWAAEITESLSETGYDCHFASIDTRDFVRGLYGCDHARYRLPSGCTVHYVHQAKYVDELIANADTVLIRHDYRIYRHFTGSLDPGRHAVVQILAGERPEGLQWWPECRGHSLLVNSPKEVQQYATSFDSCEVFLKPATRGFRERPEERPLKRYDLAFICWSTAVKRKRFDLFLDGIEQLLTIREGPLSVLVVGDASQHHVRLQKLESGSDRLRIARVGVVHHREVPALMRSARVTVVTSDSDANPQVIGESIACDTPVACAANISGGGFQINPYTGELFADDANSLADTLHEMLRSLSRYRPAVHGLKLEDAVSQIKRLVAGHESTLRGRASPHARM